MKKNLMVVAILSGFLLSACATAPDISENQSPGDRVANPVPLYFAFDQALLDSSDKVALCQKAKCIIKAHKSDPTRQYQVAGNTDNVGTREYNLTLGSRRAQAAKDFLVDQGVPESLLSTASYGEERPIADNNTKEGRAKNRRVDITLVKSSQ